MLEELKQKLKEKSEELKSVKAENKDQLEAINKLLQEHEENINKVRLAILLVLRFNDKKCHCYRPQRSCGKVIFSEACVKNSVHGGGGGVCLSACWDTQTPRADISLADGHCRGRHASYWNAFLFH